MQAWGSLGRMGCDGRNGDGMGVREGRVCKNR